MLTYDCESSLKIIPSDVTFFTTAIISENFK